MREIQNVSDQLVGFVIEVADCVEKLKGRGFSIDQAIKITQIAVEDIRIDLEHRKNKHLESMVDAIDRLTNAIEYK